MLENSSLALLLHANTLAFSDSSLIMKPVALKLNAAEEKFGHTFLCLLFESWVTGLSLLLNVKLESGEA